MPTKSLGPPSGSNNEEIEIELAPEPSASPSGDAPVVLVVDDDASIRTMLVHALGKTYTIYEASDGIEAKAVLDAIPLPSAIVCDVMMPRMDGFQLAKQLRKDKNLSRIPILFLTAKDGAMDVITGINAGARHYVTKPFKIAEVVAKVGHMTGKK
ncbi:MAG TPA: response regulator [Polyangiaceae bacterium]|jgi:DNA-binding response OmpR family regulator|nr:response regulator [Polyangiaceae bacterium]